jgi:chromosome partitioning protein
MRILASAAHKGGVGKTTLAAHLAVEAERAGADPVVLLDTDPQESLTDWHKARVAERPTLLSPTLKTLSNMIAELRARGAALAIVDTPPGSRAAISAALAVADLVLIPAQPSPIDLRAVGTTVDMVEDAGKPLIFVINRATPRTRLAAQAAVALSQHGKIAPVTVHQRVEYAEAMTDGRTAGELHPEGMGQKEISELWAYINAQMRKRASAPVRASA